MVVTDRFVYIHMPKTGGTFVTAALERIYTPPRKRTLWGRAQRAFCRRRYRDIHKHGEAWKIPEQYRHLPVVGCIRSPYDRTVSMYYFRWWRRRPELYPGIEELPGYPELSFESYTHYLNEGYLRCAPGAGPEPTIGWHTYQFLSYYGREPKALLRQADQGTLTVEELRAGLVTDSFLKTERLNQDLYEYLGRMGVPDGRRAFILETPKILPGKAEPRAAEQTWQKQFTPELKAYVRERERLLFELFPEFDV